MSLAFPDLINIITVTDSGTFHVETEDSPSTQSKAYVEEESQIRYGVNGSPVDPMVLIMLPPEAVIKKGDFVELVRVHSRTPIGDELRKRKVERAAYRGGVTVSHIEVMV